MLLFTIGENLSVVSAFSEPNRSFMHIMHEP